jgi:hypothetical protein
MGPFLREPVQIQSENPHLPEIGKISGMQSRSIMVKKKLIDLILI